eukprot:CAMPEP_0115883300 /NCGR_PEP_ID=MMETSP0287-20121206/29492_1 /TAXON_ID=412157 /ORGANISM="Chrysochromulina rotalis, Strain UIO044" /LENGTH=80 /DNA_ID=CAMNT_0003339491 /DNA_START=126 /DNA_END=368 /DNA_ORIENTATION=+
MTSRPSASLRTFGPCAKCAMTTSWYSYGPSASSAVARMISLLDFQLSKPQWPAIRETNRWYVPESSWMTDPPHELTFGSS